MFVWWFGYNIMRYLLLIRGGRGEVGGLVFCPVEWWRRSAWLLCVLGRCSSVMLALPCVHRINLTDGSRARRFLCCVARMQRNQISCRFVRRALVQLLRVLQLRKSCSFILCQVFVENTNQLGVGCKERIFFFCLLFVCPALLQRTPPRWGKPRSFSLTNISVECPPRDIRQGGSYMLNI